MVMPEEPVFELAFLGDLLQEIRQRISLIEPRAQLLLYRGRAAVGDDVVHRPPAPLQIVPGSLVSCMFLRVPLNAAF